MGIEQWRADTPGTEHVIHLNNAGASLMPQPVAAAVARYQQQELLRGGYETAAAYAAELEAFYPTAARLVGAQPQDIFYATSATDAWTRLFFSIPWQAGDIILTGHSEYASNYIAFLQVQKRHGVVVQVVPPDAQGALDVAALERMIGPRVRLIALTHLPTNGGLVNPAAAVGQVAQAHGIWYLLDACQSAGQLPLDVAALGCDMLTATGRKYLRGPRGTGFGYVSQRVQAAGEPLMLDLFSAEWTAPDAYELRPDARRYELWEHNLAAKLGLKVAMEYAMAIGMDTIQARVQHLATYLRQQIAALPGLQVQDLGSVNSGLVSIQLKEGSAREAVLQLRQQDINTSLISPRGTLLDMQSRGLGEMIRASVHYYNTEAEIDQLVAALAAFVRGAE